MNLNVGVLCVFPSKFADPRNRINSWRPAPRDSKHIHIPELDNG